MRKRNLTTFGKEFLELKSDQIDQFVMPAIGIYEEQYNKILNNEKLNKEIKLILLKNLQEELTNLLLQYEGLKKNKQNLLLVKNIQQTQNQILKGTRKFFYLKKLYYPKLELKDYSLKVDYCQYEYLKGQLQKRKLLQELIKRRLKQEVMKYMNLKEKNEKLENTLENYTEKREQRNSQINHYEERLSNLNLQQIRQTTLF